MEARLSLELRLFTFSFQTEALLYFEKVQGH